jgi:hypothetical protein
VLTINVGDSNYTKEAASNISLTGAAATQALNLMPPSIQRCDAEQLE